MQRFKPIPIVQFTEREVTEGVAWLRDVQRVTDPAKLEAYAAGIRQGIARTILRERQSGALDRETTFI